MGRGAFFTVMSALLGAAFLWRPAGPPLCSWKLLAGVGCPGCGMIRSVTSFAQGRLEDSIRFHLFGPLVFAAMAALWVVAAHGLVKKRAFRVPDTPAFRTSLGVALTLLLGYWGARLATGGVP